MARESLVDVVASALLERVVDGRTPPGRLLPPETELAAEHDVSRLTVREALKVLQTQGVVEVQRGRGTVVRPTSTWTAIDAVALALDRSGGEQAALQLLQLRRMVESGAAELAAAHRTDADLAELEHHLAAMRTAHDATDVAGFVAADIAFHDVVFRASGNPFVAVLLGPLSAVLRARREETSRHEPVQVNAIAEHTAVLEAVRSADPATARAAMESHMDQTLADLRRHVLGR